MKKSLFFLISFLFLISFVFAEADIAYIVKNLFSLEENIISEINELGLSYEIILESQVSNTDFSNYKMILLGYGNIRDAPVNEHNSLILNMNRRYYQEWSSSIGFSTLSSAYNYENEITQGVSSNFNAYIFNNPKLYYLTGQKYSIPVTVKSNTIQGKGQYVIAYKEEPRRVFFGIVEANYWTSESKELFRNSVMWILEGLLNNPPVINEIDKIVVNATEVVEIVVDAIDPDGDELFYSINDSRFVQDNKNKNQFFWQTDYSDSGNYSFKIIVFDGWVEVELEVEVEVLHKNRAPVFTDIDCESVILENEIYSCVLNAIDLEDDFFWFVVEFEENMSCNIEGNVLEYQSKEDFFGFGSCLIRVYDEFGFSEKKLEIEILPINRPPEFLNYSPLEESIKLLKGQEKIFRVEYFDFNDDSLYFAWLVNSKEVSNNKRYVFNKSIGSYVLEAFVSDGEYNKSVFWDVLVAEISEFSCSEVSGFVCTEKQMCSKDYLGVYDSNFCCPVRCIPKPPEFNRIDSCSVKGLDKNELIRLEFDFVNENYLPLDEINSRVLVFNGFKDEHDFELNIYLYDLNSDRVLEKERKRVRLGAGERGFVDFSFIVPERLGDGEHGVFVMIEDKRENYCSEGYVLFNVERREYDVRFDKKTFLEYEIGCGSFKGEFRIKNFGTVGHEDVYVVIENRELGIDYKSELFNLRESERRGSEYTMVYEIEFPKNVSEGSYGVNAIVFYGNRQTRENINFVVGECNFDDKIIFEDSINLNENKKLVLNEENNKSLSFFERIMNFIFRIIG